MVKTKAGPKLDRHIKRLGITRAEAARQLGVSAPALYYYIAGVQRPKADTRKRIAIWSNNQVAEDAWLLDTERKQIAGQSGAVGK